MKSNKGFTLIELLAVIVILAIIALIATPIILDVIDTAKKGSAKSSALGYIDAVENQVMLTAVDDNALDIPKSTTYAVAALATAKVEVKGEAPSAGKVTINEKGMVSSAKLQFKDYFVDYTYSGTGEPTVNVTATNSGEITFATTDKCTATVSDNTITYVACPSE